MSRQEPGGGSFV